MPRLVSLFTGQWAKFKRDKLLQLIKEMGYSGVELACWGDHIEVLRADDGYCAALREQLDTVGLECKAISAHLVGQAVCDNIDARHKAILPDHVWGDGEPEGVRQRAAEELIRTAEVAKRLGVGIVNGFTGSSIWHLHYSFPPVPDEMIEAGFADFARRFKPILDVYQELGVKFALEVHPTEIAFDTDTADKAIEAIGGHPAFNFNYDPSHLAYQGVDYIDFIHHFGPRIAHVHMKDVVWGKGRRAGVFSSKTFGHPDRYWDFRSPGRGRVRFTEIISALNSIGYEGPLSVEWEQSDMEQIHGAREACKRVRGYDYPRSNVAFDAAFSEQGGGEEK